MGALPYSVECRVGRLVEARLLIPRTPAEVGAFAEELRRVFTSLPGKFVICADWCAATLLAPDVADALADLLRRGNPFIERSAILLSRNNALFGLQVERVIREAGNPARRTFRQAAPMRSWLAEVLRHEERISMNEFLADYAA
jgi:hypothetical protein